MKNNWTALMLVIAAFAAALISWSLFPGGVAYVGGAQDDTIRDVMTDSQGNIYLAGGTASLNFTTTPSAYDRTFNGWHDVFVMKLDPNGNVIWSTFIGGPNYDRAYAIEVDSQGYVYVAGRAGSGFPVTPDAFQTAFQGGQATTLYGHQDGFVAKLTPDGSGLVWASYFGTSDAHIIRDIAIDQSGDVCIAAAYLSGTYTPAVATAFQNGFQETPQGNGDGVVAKIKSDGSQVLWATYLAGSGQEAGESSIRADSAGNVYYLTATNSTDMPTSSNAFNRTINGGWDFYLAKLTPDGKLAYGTYLGGVGNEIVETHELAVDAQGNAYIASGTTSADFPTRPAAFQRTYSGSGGTGTGAQTNYPGDVIVVKISADGSQLLASTFVGGQFGEGAEGVAVDALGNVYFTGATYSDNFPVTTNAFQAKKSGSADFFAAKLSADFSQLLYSTYLGDRDTDYGRAAHTDSQGNFYVAGMTLSNDWPLPNAFQSSLGGGWDAALAKFGFSTSQPMPLIVPSSQP